MTSSTADRGSVAPEPAASPIASPADEVEAMGYEQARDALVEVVRALESGAASLEESLALWERGEALARRCEHWLDGARARLDAALAERERGPA